MEVSDFLFKGLIFRFHVSFFLGVVYSTFIHTKTYLYIYIFAHVNTSVHIYIYYTGQVCYSGVSRIRLTHIYIYICWINGL